MPILFHTYQRWTGTYRTYVIPLSNTYQYKIHFVVNSVTKFLFLLRDNRNFRKVPNRAVPKIDEILSRQSKLFNLLFVLYLSINRYPRTAVRHKIKKQKYGSSVYLIFSYQWRDRLSSGCRWGPRFSGAGTQSCPPPHWPAASKYTILNSITT